MPSGEQQLRILIVDDDEASRFLVRKVVESRGNIAIECGDVKSALIAAEKHAPHVILLDLMMPDASGFDFLNVRGKDPVLRQIPVVVMSGLKDAESVYRAASLGAPNYVTKPIDARILTQKILKAIQNVKYPVRKFAPGQGPKLSVRLNGRITLANEVGFLLEIPAKLAEGTRVQIQSPFIQHIEATSAVFCRSDRPAKYFDEGHYLNEINVVGLPPSAVERIRKLLREDK